MFSVYLQCAPILNMRTQEWSSHVIKLKARIEANDEAQALSLAKRRFPQFGNRLMVQ